MPFRMIAFLANSTNVSEILKFTSGETSKKPIAFLSAYVSASAWSTCLLKAKCNRLPTRTLGMPGACWKKKNRFIQVWTSLGKFGQVCARLGKFEQIWSQMQSITNENFGDARGVLKERKQKQVYTSLGKFGQVWASLDKFGQVWASLDKFGDARGVLKIRKFQI